MVDIDSLSVAPGDVILCRYHGAVPQATAERLKAILREAIPDERIKILVMSDCPEISVIRQRAA